MPSIGDLVRVTACSNLFSQQACNVFYYVVAAWTGGLSIPAVLEKWNEDIALTASTYLSTALTPNTLKWENVDNPAEVVAIPGGFAGASLGEPMPGFVAISFRMFGETAITRSGWKRLPGVSEADVASGSLSGGAATFFQSWADAALAAPFASEEPGDFLLEPVVVGRNTDGSLNLSAVNPIVTVTVQPRVTTQNTRKVGRGV